MAEATQTGVVKVVRLSVNLAADVAVALKELVKRHGSSITDEVRRAISVYKFYSDEVEVNGNKILVQRGSDLLEVRFF